MKLKEILADLSKVEKSTVVSISPGPAVISAGSSDGMAAKLLLWLYDQMPEESTAQDLHDVLDAAKWWTTFLESVHYSETHLTQRAADLPKPCEFCGSTDGYHDMQKHPSYSTANR